MNTEKMTIREALSQKKLLDKQIGELAKFDFVTVATADTKVIDGMTIADHNELVKETWQSLNDKIRRREAIANAILVANVSNTITVPKFISFDKIDANATDEDKVEEITFASAIARKNYYKTMLSSITNNFINKLNEASSDYRHTKEKIRTYITAQLTAEFGNATNASTKQRSERQAELEAQFEAIYINPVELTVKAGKARMAIDEYLCKIDSLLGHATEITYITFEY